MKVQGVAQQPIPFGAMVLYRDYRVSIAGPEIADGKACERPKFCHETHYKKGQAVLVEMIEGLGTRSLQAMADGPIMDPRNLFLPAGKVSMAEYRDRVAADVTDLSDTARHGDRGRE